MGANQIVYQNLTFSDENVLSILAWPLENSWKRLGSSVHANSIKLQFPTSCVQVISMVIGHLEACFQLQDSIVFDITIDLFNKSSIGRTVIKSSIIFTAQKDLRLDLKSKISTLATLFLHLRYTFP